MSSQSRRWVPVLIGLLLLAGASSPAWAHAILMDSTPKLNASVNGPEVAIVLRFNVRVDGSRSRLQLVAPDGSAVNLAIPKQSSPDTLQSTANALKPGMYKLTWHVLASDGHMSRGEVPFTVK